MEYTLHTYMGEDCPVAVKYEHEPAEKQTHDYPGCPEKYIINAVLVNGKDVQADCNEEYIETLKGRCRYEHNKKLMEQYEQEQQER